MKSYMVLLMAIVTFAATGCSKDEAKGGVSYKDAAMQTMPALSSSAISATLRSYGLRSFAMPDITWGNMSDEVNIVLLDPTPWEADGTSLGTNNIYHLLNDMDGAMNGVPFSSCSGINSVSSIPWFEDHASPTGFHPVAWSKEYKCKGDDSSGAYGKKDGNTYYGMYTTKASSGSSTYEGILNKDTGDIQVRMVGIWPASDGKYTMRSEFKGNMNTHTFTVLLTKYNTMSGGYYIQMVGTGVSRGDTSYFLMKVKDNSLGGGSGTTLGSAYYYCYAAATSQSTDDTSTISTTSNCKTYKATVDALTGFVNTDLPTDLFETTITTN